MNDAASSDQPVSSTDSGSGAALLAERRRQNLSLGDVSRQLKLSVRQVEALERDDFSGYQGPVFVHGFIRNYAKLLALDPVPLIRAADRLLNPAPVQVEAGPVPARVSDAPRGGKSMWPFVAGTVVVVLVAGLMFMNRGGNEPEEPQVPKLSAGEQLAAVPATNEKRQPDARPADKRIAGKPVVDKPVAEKPVTEKSSAEKPAPKKQVEERGAAEKRVEASAPASQENLPRPITRSEAMETGPRMRIRMIFDQDSWVEIKDRSGNTVFGQLNAAGTRRSASGEPPLSIVVGNAAGVRLFKGDKSIDLAPHTRVDVARLTIE